jgi:DNA-binding MarR family transcriptional regulator
MVMLTLTERGRALYKAHQRFHLELVKSLIVDLSEYEAEMFIDALSSLNGFLARKTALC